MFNNRANMLCRLSGVCVCMFVLIRINNNNIGRKKNTQRTVYLRKIVNNNEYLYIICLCARTVLYIIVHYYIAEINALSYDLLGGARRVCIYYIHLTEE
jgi:hypothetical protein